MSLVGIEDGLGGRGCMKESGVLGGSMLGTTFFQASTNAESAQGAAGGSVERNRPQALEQARPGWRRRAVVARRSMAEEGLGIARLWQGREICWMQCRARALNELYHKAKEWTIQQQLRT